EGALAGHEHPAPIAADGRVVVVPAGNAFLDVFLHSLPVFGVLQSRQHRGRAAFVGPGRDDARQVVVAAGVRIDVGLDVDAALAGLFDQADQFVHAAPELLVGDLEVDHVHGNPGTFPDGDRFLNGGDHLGPFVADVRRKDPLVLADDLAQLDDVVAGGQGARHL